MLKIQKGDIRHNIEEIAGVNTQGETLEQARENLKEAFEMVMEANRAISQKELAKGCELPTHSRADGLGFRSHHSN